MVRGPPNTSRREDFVDLALRYAEDDSHGYSQKPPSGRWGPDFDCSSLLYYLADKAGYPVGTGSDKVRFTGTMLKDFEKAGFQILPFANVGISDLEIGDILLNLALHAEVYVGNGESVGATGSETGGFVGEAGDQTGSEIERHPVTTFDKEWDYILRPPADEKDEEGDEEVPMNYNQPMQNPQGMMYQPNTGTPGWPQSTAPMGYAPGNNGYPQGTRWNNGSYPQGNLGQMNGYSQANAGYPQGGMQGGYSQGMTGYPQSNMQNVGIVEDLEFVKGIEGANQTMGTPNSRKTYYDDDTMHCYIITYGPQGRPVDIHPYELNDCSEEMPQHLSPLMRQNMMPIGGMEQPANFVTREEFEQLKEMLLNAQSSSQAEPNASRSNGTSQSANAGRSR